MSITYDRCLDAALNALPIAALASALGRVLPAPHIAGTTATVRVRGLGRGLTGLRLLHVSDLHLRRGSELSLQLPAIAAGLVYDVALYTGDFIDDDNGIEAVRALLARMPRVHASYAVLGNHDYHTNGNTRRRNNVARLTSALAAVGLGVLCNDARPLGPERALYIAGVDDPSTRRDHAAAALSAVPAAAPCILLAHSPDVMLRLGARRPDLVLAGHTHGGQIRLPGMGPVATKTDLPRAAAMGWSQCGGTPLFVSRGIGYSGVDLRLGCPPEVTLIVLHGI